MRKELQPGSDFPSISLSTDQQFFICIPPWNTMAQIPSQLLADTRGTQVELLSDLKKSHRSCIPVPGITAFHMHQSLKPIMYN